MRYWTRAIALYAILASVALPGLAQEPSLLNAPAPKFDLPSLDGERVNLVDLRGRILVLHFGTGW